MVDIQRTRWLHKSCGRRMPVNAGGKITKLCCKRHAENGTAGVRSNRCSHDSCTAWPRWGHICDSLASVCSRHKSNLTAGSVVDFNRKCGATKCRLVATWGLADSQPTHCPDHGRLRDGLSPTLGFNRRGNNSSSSSYRAKHRPSVVVKAECLF